MRRSFYQKENKKSICFGGKVVAQALSAEMTDFEDAVQAAAAYFNGIDYIAARNVKDCRKPLVKAVLPEKLYYYKHEEDEKR